MYDVAGMYALVWLPSRRVHSTTTTTRSEGFPALFLPLSGRLIHPPVVLLYNIGNSEQKYWMNA